jgi:hypothetical protein
MGGPSPIEPRPRIARLREETNTREALADLVKDEAALRRSHQEAAHAQASKRRLPVRLISTLVLATIVLVAGTKAAMEIMVLLQTPGDAPVRPLSLDDVAAMVPATAIHVEEKRLTVEVSSLWDGLGKKERSERFSALCGSLANHAYHGATLVAPDGRTVGTWGKGLIRVE